jgi:hypothetical protein
VTVGSCSNRDSRSSALAWSKRASAIRRSWFSRSARIDELIQHRIVETLPEVHVSVGQWSDCRDAAAAGGGLAS